MAVETRSKKVAGKEGTLLDFSNESDEEIDLQEIVRQADRSTDQVNRGVKIKQEVLEQRTEKMIQSQRKSDEQNISDGEKDGEKDMDTEEVTTTSNRLRNGLPITVTNKLLNRATRPRRIGTGKRRIQGNRSHKSNKKYFQDIHEFAKTLPTKNKFAKNETRTRSEETTNGTTSEEGLAITSIATTQPEQNIIEINLDHRGEDDSDTTHKKHDATDTDIESIASEEYESESESEYDSMDDDTISSGGSDLNIDDMIKSYSINDRRTLSEISESRRSNDFKNHTEAYTKEGNTFKKLTGRTNKTETKDKQFKNKSPSSLAKYLDSNAFESDSETRKDNSNEKRDKRNISSIGNKERRNVRTYGLENNKHTNGIESIGHNLISRDKSNTKMDHQFENEPDSDEIMLSDTEITNDSTTSHHSNYAQTNKDAHSTNTNVTLQNETVGKIRIQESGHEKSTIPMTNSVKKRVGFNNMVHVRVIQKEEKNSRWSNQVQKVFQPQNTYNDTPMEQKYPQFNLIAKAKTDWNQTIKERGYNMVEDNTVIETPVKVEFNIDRSLSEYNIREKIIELLELMKIVDNNIKVKSTTKDSSEWENLTDLPEDEEFSTNFQVREFTYRKFRKILVHLKLITKTTVNRIKFSTEVKEFIFKNNIWLKTDWFNTKVESSPGILTMINPKLTNKETYKGQLIEALKRASVNMALEAGEENDLVSKDVDLNNDQQSVPIFYLETSIKKWGDVSTEVIRINCAKEESEKLKYLFSTACEQGLLTRGTFIPAGLHLMEGKLVVTNILKEHVAFLAESTGIPISGLTVEDMHRNYGTETTVKETIEHTEGVESVELIRVNKFQGQWLIVTKKDIAQTVLGKLELKLGSFYRNQEGQSKLIMLGAKRLNSRSDQTNKVATYAEILSKKYSEVPVETTRETANKQNLLKAKQNPRTENMKALDRNRTTPSHQVQDNDTDERIPDKPTTDSTIMRKLEKIEEIQAQLIKNQNELKQSQKERDRVLQEADNEAEQKEKQKYIDEMIDSRLSEISINQQKLVQESHESIHAKVDQLVNKKINVISVTVANQVAAQLIHVFK